MDAYSSELKWNQSIIVYHYYKYVDDKHLQIDVVDYPLEQIMP